MWFAPQANGLCEPPFADFLFRQFFYAQGGKSQTAQRLRKKFVRVIKKYPGCTRHTRMFTQLRERIQDKLQDEIQGRASDLYDLYTDLDSAKALGSNAMFERGQYGYPSGSECYVMKDSPGNAICMRDFSLPASKFAPIGEEEMRDRDMKCVEVNHPTMGGHMCSNEPTVLGAAAVLYRTVALNEHGAPAEVRPAGRFNASELSAEFADGVRCVSAGGKQFCSANFADGVQDLQAPAGRCVALSHKSDGVYVPVHGYLCSASGVHGLDLVASNVAYANLAFDKVG